MQSFLEGNLAKSIDIINAHIYSLTFLYARLGLYLTDLFAQMHSDTYICLLITELFIIANKWKQHSVYQ